MAQNGTKRKCNDKKENKILGIMAENNSIPQFVNSDSFMADKNYVKWLSDLKKRFRVAQLKAAVKVNTEMLKFYWSLGEDICEKQKQYKWGAKVIGRLSLDLRAEFPQNGDFPEQTCMILNVGLRSIQVKLNLSTRLVDNYRKWIMPIHQCQKSCFLCLGDIKRLLFLNAIR